jgi:hypothetical protein
MENNNMQYFLWMILAILSTMIWLNIISQDPVFMIIWFSIFIILINISSILFYKSLNVEKKYLKYLFSIVNILCYPIIGAILWSRVLEIFI